MTDHTPAPDPRDHDPAMAAAAERLRADAGQVDTMAAMHRVTGDDGRAWFRPALLFGGLAVAILAVIGVVALLNNDDGETVVADGDEDQPVAHELEGTSWTLVIGDGPGGVISPPDGWPVTISFDRDTFGGTASCNGYGGSFTLGEDGSITLTEVGSTAMGCEPAPMETEAAFLAALSGVESYEVSGDSLLLFGETTELTFERQAPVPTAELVGQLWLLDTLIQGETATTVSGHPATLLLNADGTLEGGTGCRSLSGTWIEAAGQIVFTEFAAEGNSCTPDLTDQDGLVVTVLGDGFVPTIESTRLTVMSAGNEGLSYQAVDSAPEPADRETLAKQLTGTSWSLLEGQGPTGPIVSSNPITLEFIDGGIEGAAPCNTYSAVTVFEGDQIEIFDLVTTERACDDLDAESEFYAALAAISSVAVDGAGGGDPVLVMAGGNSEMIFERSGADPSPDRTPSILPPDPTDGALLDALVSTPWQLVDASGTGISTSGVTLEFSASGEFSGQAHCNAYGGTFDLEGEMVRFGPVEAQEEGCDESDSEDAYFGALADVDIAVVDDSGYLVLNLGANELIFVPEGAEFVPEPQQTEFSVGELLDLRPEGVVTVTSGPITYGRTTILCDAEDLNPDEPTRCLGRWVVVTNYNDLIDDRGPFNGFLREDGRFQIVGPGSGVEQRGSGVDLTQDDELLLEPLLWLTEGVPVEEALEGFRSHLAPTVDLWLGPDLPMPPLSRDDAGAPASWQLDDGGLGFEGFAGPFSVVDTLLGADEVQITVGPHDHCAGQPRQYADALQGLRQLSIQPTGIDSCIAWFSVDVFVNDAGEIEAVMLDLFGP